MNEARKKRMAEQVIDALRRLGRGQDGRACWASPSSPTPTTCATARSLDIVPALQKAGATVRAFDPEGMDEAKKLMPDVTYCHDAYDCMTGADALVDHHRVERVPRPRSRAA